MRAHMKHLARRINELRADASGVMMVEFAYSLPILIGVTFYGLEAANLATAHLKVSQIASMVADNAARVRVAIDEDDINEMFIGAKLSGEQIKFMDNGRIILSSVQPVATGSPATVTAQKIRWQRCIGANPDNSSYGLEGDTKTGANSMGATGREIGAISGSEMIFVEVRYKYQPLINNIFFGEQTLTVTRALTVRDRKNQDIQSGTTTVRSCGGTHIAI